MKVSDSTEELINIAHEHCFTASRNVLETSTSLIFSTSQPKVRLTAFHYRTKLSM